MRVCVRVSGGGFDRLWRREGATTWSKVGRGERGRRCVNEGEEKGREEWNGEGK